MDYTLVIKYTPQKVQVIIKAPVFSEQRNWPSNATHIAPNKRRNNNGLECCCASYHQGASEHADAQKDLGRDEVR